MTDPASPICNWTAYRYVTVPSSRLLFSGTPDKRAATWPSPTHTIIACLVAQRVGRLCNWATVGYPYGAYVDVLQVYLVIILLCLLI